MATMFGQSVDHASGKGSIVDDFMYGSNVASSHVYIRLGKLSSRPILEDNLSRDLLYQMSNIEYPYVNNDWLWV